MHPQARLAVPEVQASGPRPHQMLAEHPAWSGQRIGGRRQLVSLFTKHRDPAVGFAKEGWWMDGRGGWGGRERGALWLGHVSHTSLHP